MTDLIAEVEKPLDGGARMSAYYYTFTATGLGVIDKILSAVACAGKAYHHTDDWQENTPAFSYHAGVTPVDWIQNAAGEATETIRALVARCKQAEASYQEAQLTIAGLEAERDHYRKWYTSALAALETAQAEAARLREQVEGKYAEGYAAAVEDHL